MRTSRSTRRVAAVATALALALAACAGDDTGDVDDATTSDDATSAATDDDMASMSDDDMASMSDDDTASMSDDDTASMSDDDMASMSDDDMASMDMGAADGPRADEADAAQLREADLVVLDGAPDPFADATGTAWLALDPMTWLTVDVEGLAPGTEIVGHLHAESCATNGGPHFRFDPEGGDMPPNEVHVSGAADDDGSLTVSVTNDMVAADAFALVLHATDGDTTKALCADLAPTQ